MYMASANGPEKKIENLPQKDALDFPRSWVDDFVEATAPLSSPELFRRWAGIVTIAGALERKIWVRTKGTELYPNLYVVLAAPPGIGKTEIIGEVREMWSELKTHHIAHSSVTKASLIDSLAASERNIVRPAEIPPVVTFNSLLVGSNELGVLIPSYDMEFMSTLTDLYDGKGYGEARRTNKINISIPKPNISIIAGCTPGYLRESLPMGAWDQGFLSRVIIVYSGETERRSFFEETHHNIEAIKRLQEQLKEFANLYGKLSFTPDAAKLIDTWQMGSREPLPEHPRLAHYNTRRPAHLLKLSMIAAVATGSYKVIDTQHVQLAMDWLFDVEYYMPEIFKAMATGGDSKVIEDTFHHLYTLYMREGQKPIGEHRLVHFLQEHTPSHNIMRILDVMERSRMIEKRLEKGLGVAYVPVRMKKI